MKAMILAAGRGERMRPLTDSVPKALLAVASKPLIVWQIERLVAGGFTDLVVNHAWLGEQIEAALGDGSAYGARIAWSREHEALETAGGIVTALPLLSGDRSGKKPAKAREPFAVVSADIYTDFDYARLGAVIAAIREGYPNVVAHLVFTDNPPWHPEGDLALVGGSVSRRVSRHGALLTYANIGVLHPGLFDGLAAGERLKLFPWVFGWIDEGRVTGEHFSGLWENVGTASQLAALDRRLRDRSSLRFPT